MSTENARENQFFQKRIEVIYRKLGSISDISKKTGISQQALYDYRKAKSEPSRTRLIELANAAGVSVEWLATGRGPMHPGEPEEREEEGELVKIPRYEAYLSAGEGSWNSDQAEVIDHIAFPKRWLSHTANRGTAEDLMLLEVEGDSMEPTISRGDLVLIDTRNCHDRVDGIYAFVQEGTAKVKRLHFLEGWQGIEVISDNSALYSKQRLADHDLEGFHVIGRVCWIGKSLKS